MFGTPHYEKPPPQRSTTTSPCAQQKPTPQRSTTTPSDFAVTSSCDTHTLYDPISTDTHCTTPPLCRPSSPENSDNSRIGHAFNKLLKQIGNPVEFELPDWFIKPKAIPYVFIKRNIYLTKRIKRRLEDDGIFCSCTASPGSSGVCDRDCHCGMLLSSCSSGCKCGNSCLNKPFQNRPVKKMKLVQTEKCGAGIVADEDIKRGEFVIEYVGEVIDDKTCEERLWKMKHLGETNFYLCEINRDMTSLFEHWFVQFGADQDCHCGAAGCRRKLGAKPSKPKISSDAALKLVACQVAVSSPKLKAILSGKDNGDLHIGSSRPPYNQRQICPQCCIGKVIRISHPKNESSFGIIRRFDEYSRKHSVLFEDGESEFIDMAKVDWELVTD
ncbi:Histone-lysine N-methyltransferase ASHH3 [Citrus sinensis]|nr:Histone-lysine N-methyltransferase ASHH3 [Citrus sinensis]